MFTGIFGFWFAAIDGFYGNPDSLEAALVIAALAAILTALTVAVPLTIAATVARPYFGFAIVTGLLYIKRAVRAVRSVAPLWAWAAALFLAYVVGTAFGEMLYPHHTTFAGIVCTAFLAGMALAGNWVAKQSHKTAEFALAAFVALIIVTIVVSAPFFTWAVAPGIGILAAFFGIVGLIPQSIIRARQQNFYHA